MKISYRQATLNDINDLVRLRRLMFEDMGVTDKNQLDIGDKKALGYFHRAITSNEFISWIALNDNENVVGSGVVVIDQHPPGPINHSGKIGYIMNVVTIPNYRRKGIARQIMKKMIEWLTLKGVQIISLHTSKIALPLYEELGFKLTNEMRLIVNK